MVLPCARCKAQNTINVFLSSCVAQDSPGSMSMPWHHSTSCSMLEWSVHTALGVLVAPLRRLWENWRSPNLALAAGSNDDRRIERGKYAKESLRMLCCLYPSVISCQWLSSTSLGGSHSMYRVVGSWGGFKRDLWGSFLCAKTWTSSWSRSLLQCCWLEWVI